MEKSFFDKDNFSKSILSCSKEDKKTKKKIKELIIARIRYSKTFCSFYINDFYRPKYLSLPEYKNKKEIQATFKSTRIWDNNRRIKITPKCQFIIIRSLCDDDIHKAIKYGVWTSTSRTNNFLKNIYLNTNKIGGEVFLFFTTKGSGFFSGIAQIISEFDERTNFDFWWEEIRWKGVFKIRWLYIKDFLYENVQDLKIEVEGRYNKRQIRSVDNCFDGCQIPFDIASEFLERYFSDKTEENIFDSFHQMDEREVLEIRPGRDQVYKIIDKMKRHNIFEFFLKKNEFKSDLDFEREYSLQNGKKNLKVPSLFDYQKGTNFVRKFSKKDYEIHKLNWIDGELKNMRDQDSKEKSSNKIKFTKSFKREGKKK